MKKLISLLLVLVMALSVLAGCASSETTDPTDDEIVQDPTDGETVDPTNGENEGTTDGENEGGETPASTGSVAILESIWALYADSEKFALMGGNPEAAVMDAPAAWDAAYMENLPYTLQMNPEELVNIDEAATMIHMMNANTFTGAALHMVEGADVAAFASSLRDSIQGAQWICGFPEALVIASVNDEYVVVAFGGLVSTFQAHLTEAYPDAQILYSEAIGG
ncbi:MAG: hypothetical protein IJX69_05200 [Oscillospiraceae bacterium]|nr:hypothetical protein [Oscillospiraceae bacterium]